ncbi:MAG: RNA 2',3'-cyclic phosphodiesterase, partial [Candidatus Thorarchaeota archaeon]
MGDTSLSRIEEIRSRLCDIALSPFAVRIEGVGAFPSVRRPNVIWVGVAENRDRINQIKSAIDQRLAELGYSLDRRFHPHATIARVRAV